MGQIIRSPASVCLTVCLSVCQSSLLWSQFWIQFDEALHGRWGRKTKIEFVGGGQNPIMPSPISPKLSPVLMHFQRDGLSTAVSTPVDRLW